jgi:hypothetical protein
MIFLLFVSALISAGTVVGQGSQYKIVGRALKETALQELTMDAAQALLADILHDLELLRTEEGQEALVLTVDSMLPSRRRLADKQMPAEKPPRL